LFLSAQAHRLDQYEVDDYRAWHAHITLSMLAAAYLAATRARTDPAPLPGEKGGPPPVTTACRLSLTNEIRRLLAALALAPARTVESVIGWSIWRRRRQHQARTCHYRRRGHRPP
jgi:hypothetical protein